MSVKQFFPSAAIHQQLGVKPPPQLAVPKPSAPKPWTPPNFGRVGRAMSVSQARGTMSTGYPKK